ncbi:MetQ/NlpA family ABC transporter substrate-binding protein [Corynebacterium terpenotabidum]|uniref:Methionine ABC transport system substrate-binding protein n=1 Tax=Corynebacterium terpenotabidum Y-11 TaxID=1200352 RepID=S4XIG7_9CORY|nr:MetQ/NlpA family ABC transporter substrate-binding protein [Corynebacterium terpenotabidum]AGP31485.1 methionine ABC transport system substrate-binding protein [Corynebacterium terpenotabidum Y-11]
MHIRRNPLLRTAVAVTVALGLTAGVTACADDGNDDSVITIGSTEADKSQWKVFQEKAEEAGLNVEIKGFTDYNTPNRALSEGDLDVNQFQHILFLADYNVNSNADLVPFGATQIFPLGLYFKDGTTVADVEEAGEVVVPSDTTNQGRAINVLVQAGLVTLKKDGLLSPTPADIDTDSSKVTVTAVDASQTVTAYQDGTPAVINNNFLEGADVTAADAVFKDDPSKPEAQPYINVWVTTADQVDNADYLKLVEIFHDPEVQAAVQEDTNGSAVEVTTSAEELQEILADTEAKIKEQN